MTPDRHPSEDELVRAHLHLANQAVHELARRTPCPPSPGPTAACSDFRARLDAAPRPLLERAAESGWAAPTPA